MAIIGHYMLRRLKHSTIVVAPKEEVVGYSERHSKISLQLGKHRQHTGFCVNLYCPKTLNENAESSNLKTSYFFYW